MDDSVQPRACFHYNASKQLMLDSEMTLQPHPTYGTGMQWTSSTGTSSTGTLLRVEMAEQ